MKRFSAFIWGVVFTLICIGAGGYLFISRGGVSMDTSAKPLPLEAEVARLALRASIGTAGDQKAPFSADEAIMVAGARTYKAQCSVCHGTPGSPSAISKGMFPVPPQLLEKEDMVTDDPEGVTYWKVTHGIRLSGMPAFGSTLSDNERWQVTLLVAHADKVPASAMAALR